MLVLGVYAQSRSCEFRLGARGGVSSQQELSLSSLGLAEKVTLKLLCKGDTWSFASSTSYFVFHGGQQFEGQALESGQVLQLLTRSDERIAVFVWQTTDVFPQYQKYMHANGGVLSIGTGSDCDIRCEGTGVISRRHATLDFSSEGVKLTDLSKNGIFLNGEKVDSSRMVVFGDVISSYGLAIVCLGDILAIRMLSGSFEVNADVLKLLDVALLSEKTRLYERPAPAEVMVHVAPRALPEIHDAAETIEGIPAKQEGNKRPAWMSILPSLTMVLPMALGFGLMGSGMRFGLVISVGSAVVGVFWGIINYRYSKKTERERELNRLARYGEYLIHKSDHFREEYEHNRAALRQMYPSAQECAANARAMSSLWQRKPSDIDFLYCRLGVGNMPFQVQIKVPKQEFMLNPDELSDRPEKIAKSFEMLEDVPVGVALADHGVIGVVAGEGQAAGVLRVMLTQTAVNHSYTDVKLGLLFEEGLCGTEVWKAARWLPHVWNEDRSMRYVAKDKAQAADVLYALAQVLRRREEALVSASPSQHNAMLPHYVLFASDSQALDEQMLSSYLYERGEKLGVTTVVFAQEASLLPSACSLIIECDADGKAVARSMEDEKPIQQGITLDAIEQNVFKSMTRGMASLRVRETAQGSDIPASVSFFETMGVNSLAELNVLVRWSTNKTYDSMAAPVGKMAGGATCFLDIHERFHGPHGLVAGTTGSGKSETLQTYILALATNFSPRDVGFFIIDFKGGGMANLFANLPHMMGSISNLSGNQVHRAMVSIKSENNRRQRIFGEYGVNHIDAYTKLFKAGDAKESIPHLLIIVDEFAELKREQPEFMQELISVAQVGRSLGVHLMLATQKPGGTVSDNIRSNTRFKLCLRVADRQDSTEVLKKPDAAYLTQVGRCYLQVGNDELYELFQSGYSGAPYDPSTQGKTQQSLLLDMTGRPMRSDALAKGRRKRRADLRWAAEIVAAIRACMAEENAPMPSGEGTEGGYRALAAMVAVHLNRVEERISVSASNIEVLEDFVRLYTSIAVCASGGEAAPEEVLAACEREGKRLPARKEKTELEAVVEHLAFMARQLHLESEQKLWLPPLPKSLCLDAIDGYTEMDWGNISWPEHESLRLAAFVGLVDAPESQMQFPLKLDLAANGHLTVLGGVASGKSTFLQTLVYALLCSYSPDELIMYLVDFSSQMLCCFEEAPHVGGIVLEGDDDRLAKLFGLLRKMLQERKRIVGGGSFEQFVRVNGYALPAVIVVIDGYASFREKTEDAFDDVVLQLAREAEGYGIYLVVSCASFGGVELPNKIAEKMRQSLCLEMGDKYRYIEALRVSRIEVLPEENVKGRGLVSLTGEVYEFQTAVCVEAESDYQRSEAISRRCLLMADTWDGGVAPRIPQVPLDPTWDTLAALPGFGDVLASKEGLPLGWLQEDASLYSVDLRHTYCYLVLGRQRSGKTVFLRNVMCAAKKMGADLWFVDASSGEAADAEKLGAQYFSGAEGCFKFAQRLIELTNARGEVRANMRRSGCDDDEIFERMKNEQAIVCIIPSMAAFLKTMYTKVEDLGIIAPHVEPVFEKGQNLNVYFFGAVDGDQIPAISSRPVWQSFVAERHGAVLGVELAKQTLLLYQNIRYSEASVPLAQGLAWVADSETGREARLVVVPNNRLARRSDEGVAGGGELQ